MALSPVGRPSGWLPAVALAALALAAGPAAAQETSLSRVPADAAFYSASLRNAEQLKALLDSKAVAKLKGLNHVKLALAELGKPGGPLAMYQAITADPENKEAVDLLLDMVSNEVFVYGDANWVPVLELLADVQRASNYGPALKLLSGDADGKDQNELQVQAMLDALTARADQIKVPDLVIGFKVTKAAPAETQLKRLEKLVTPLAESQAETKGRLKRVKVGGGEFLTLKLDGSQIPWDKVDVSAYEPQPGAYAPLFKKLKASTLTVSLGVQGDYVLIGIGSGTDGVAKLAAKGPKLDSAKELAPLKKFASQKITSVDYVSKAFASASAAKPSDMDDFTKLASEAVGKLELTDEQLKRIRKDIDTLGKELKALIVEPGAAASFAFMTDRGIEGYAYNYTPATAPKTDALALLDHVGGSPLAAGVGRAPVSVKAYDNFVKWVKVFYGWAEEIGKPKLNEEQKDQYDEFTKIAFPLLKRLDEITGKQFLTALGEDGESAFVLDAKWKSSQWLTTLPATDKELPLPEIGYIRTVKDSALMTKAFKEYRKLVNDTIKAVRDKAGNVPEEVEWAPPETKKTKGGATLFYYTLPAQLGLDEKVLPNLGLSDKFLTFAFSAEHAERLMTKTPLKFDSKVFTGKKGVTGAGLIDFAGMVESAEPWLKEVVLPMALQNVEKNKDEIEADVKVVVEVLKCFRGAAAVTYVEGGVTITHSETVYRDLK